MDSKVMEELVKYLKEAVEFGKDQMPSIVAQMIRKEIILDWAELGFWVMMGILAARLMRIGWKHSDDPYGEKGSWDDDASLWVTSGGGVLTCVSAVLTFTLTIDLIVEVVQRLSFTVTGGREPFFMYTLYQHEMEE